jgi:hypothetical protein
MRSCVFYIVSLFLIVFLSSLMQNEELTFNWKKIADSGYLVTYVKVITDSSSQYAIDTKVRLYNTNDRACILSKNNIKLLRDLILDRSNFNAEDEAKKCIWEYAPYAIIVMRRNEIVGLIHIGCQGELWNFEPTCHSEEHLYLNEKGMRMKEKLFKTVR